MRLAIERGDSSTAISSLPSEMIGETSRRLGWLGLIYAGGYAAGHAGQWLIMSAAGTIPPGLGMQDVFAAAGVVLGIGVFVLSRSRLLSQRQLDALGFSFYIAGAIGIALPEFWLGFPLELISFSPLVPAECVWIVVFPLIVPSAPRRVAIGSALAASAAPAGLVLSAAINGYPLERPWLYAVYFLSTTYVCAAIAYVVARLLYRIGARLKQAREIGSYEMLEPIGEGGMGKVWRARHRLLARPAAIKLIRTELLAPGTRGGDDTVRRFEREAQATAALGSIHTIDVYDYGMTREGDFYYVMELLNGISLDRYVKRFGPMPPGRVVYLLRQVCHSLSEAHDRGLLHRDIKPANIFLCRLGPDDDFVKVLDFGLVKQYRQDDPGSFPTVEEMVAGTPAFMAPELALDTSDADARADLYALGCVAYYLLTGQPVFPGESSVATLIAHVNAMPSPPSLLARFPVPAPLDALILDCLAKNKRARPRSAAELAERLAECVPADAWTAAAARLWWQAHESELQSGPGSSGDVSGDLTGTRRCFPCLDRRSRASAAA